MLQPSAVIAVSLFLCTRTLGQDSITLIEPASPLPCVVAADSQLERDAAADLCSYLSRICGRMISVSEAPKNDRVVVHVGRDRFAEENLPEIARLRADGFLIRCVEKADTLHLILAGNVERAAQWAVERFLRDYCGVRWLFPHSVYGEVVPRKTTIAVDRSLAKRYEPDFVSRANCGMYYFSPQRRLLRLGPYGYGYGDHAVQRIFSANEFRDHPEWFAFFGGKRQWWSYGNGWQICTSQRGTVGRAVEYVDEYFERNPQAPVVSIGQNDGNGWCECAACNKFVNSFSPPYSNTERWFHWVNRVARQVRGKHPGKWVEAMAYANTSEPPRFELEPNVAVTKTFVLDSEFEQAGKWRKICRSVNLYSYMYGASFLGFRHYPHAAQQFLKWGHEKLGALAHVTECAGDWTFDGPKYHYIQALQWDVDADVDAIMDDYCAASYGQAAGPMRKFWDRLEEVYERRKPGPYRNQNKDWLFYQWVSWAANSYVQPNDEFRDYTRADVGFLDQCLAEAEDRAGTANDGVRFRIGRHAEAWRYYRTMLLSYLEFYPQPLDVVVTSKSQERTALQRARRIAELRRERTNFLSKMRSFRQINPRISQPGYWSWGSAITIFSHERSLLDSLCSAVTEYQENLAGKPAAVEFWRQVTKSDRLFHAAQTQLELLAGGPVKNRLVNGDFETGDLKGWSVTNGQLAVVKELARSGQFAAGSPVSSSATLSQEISVSPLERYHLTVWGRYLTAPPDHAVPLEASVEFRDGDQGVYPEPTRGVLPELNPAAGWTRLQLAVEVPPRADRAIITLKRSFNGKTLWDDVAFKRIRKGPQLTHGSLTDSFAGETLDLTKWCRLPASGGTNPPRIQEGWLHLDRADTYAISSLAKFNDLIAHQGLNRYRLRFHTAAVSAANRPGQASFAITNSRQPTSRMLWYLYFPGTNRAQPMLSVFNDQSGVRKFSSSWNLKHPSDRVRDLWCTIYFDPVEVTVYASGHGYDESDESIVCRYKHGLSDITANGSVNLAFYTGPYKLDELSLTRRNGGQ